MRYHCATKFNQGALSRYTKAVGKQSVPSDGRKTETLEQRLARGPLAPAEILRIACEIAIALQELHRGGAAHGRLEPAGILLGPEGVKLREGGDETAACESTLPYAAPEQVRGVPADCRSDIFAFGAVLDAMAAGADPNDAESESLTRYLGLVIRDCTVKDPDRRRQRIQSVLLDLKLITVPPKRSGSPPPVAIAVDYREQKKRLSCPKCGWYDIRMSAQQGILDEILSIFRLAPYRCRTCSARFYRRRHPRRSTARRGDYGYRDPEDGQC